jgi:Rad3-related DNA helicase
LTTHRTPSASIEAAFKRLSQRPGFVPRPDQTQLALLLSDLIDGQRTGAFEAPTGLGKSLAALLPAIAHALHQDRRTIVATYTNILAEQYWRNDLPLALSLFEELDHSPERVTIASLMGRQRYACLASVRDVTPRDYTAFRNLKLGIESEFRSANIRVGREATKLWQQVATPPVCPARLCPEYENCFYYEARRQAEKAHLVITNHSVVVQDALLADTSDDNRGLLGKFDFLILDEAHDFPTAAMNGLEFELSPSKLQVATNLVHRLQATLDPLAIDAGDQLEWSEICDRFRLALASSQRSVAGFAHQIGRTGIVKTSPPEVNQHPQVERNRLTEQQAQIQTLVSEIGSQVTDFLDLVQGFIAKWKSDDLPNTRTVVESARNYMLYLMELGAGTANLFDPMGVSVSYVGSSGTDSMLRHDVIGLAEPLQKLIWSRSPWACLSATLAIDQSFDYFRRTTGATPDFEEILPSPFDFATQTSLYVPPVGRIPDPADARKNGTEQDYFFALATELEAIIHAMGGRTLALFHSRREMEAVFAAINTDDDHKILMQGKMGAASVGERFRNNEALSLFGLRSFWTGFDAPGPTLSCVVLVRIPFEVPIDPPQIARLAWMQTQGQDAFREHTLPQAKTMIRQGAGRLVRRTGDRGVIAILDPRVRTKRYGDEILANLPEGIRHFDDFLEAMAAVGLDSEELNP